jgi:Rrf2 family protein
MLLSNACEYGLRAVLYLSSLNEEGYVPIRTMSDELHISFPFLTKIFQMLTQAGLLTSYRGPNGGVALTRPPDQISLREIIVAIDGSALFEECVLGLPGCGEEKPCPLHARWAVERDRLERMFATSTLAEMAEQVGTLDVRLKSVY